MAISSTKNVNLGVCSVVYGGNNLGLTSGGVDITIKTETKQVMVDQYGKTPVNEYIMGRTVGVKVPLAETTLFNLAQSLPGSNMITAGSIAATNTITIAAQPTTGQTITVAGVTITFVTAAVTNTNQVTIGGTTALTATALGAFLTATTDSTLAGLFTNIVTTTAVALTVAAKGSAGNALLAATGTAGASVTVATATFTGGIDGTVLRIDVSPNVSFNLLATAKVLTLHPVARAAADTSDDFTLLYCAPKGDISYSYKLDAERIYTAEFNGYPDPLTGKLFAIGNIAAVNS